MTCRCISDNSGTSNLSSTKSKKKFSTSTCARTYQLLPSWPFGSQCDKKGCLRTLHTCKSQWAPWPRSPMLRRASSIWRPVKREAWCTVLHLCSLFYTLSILIFYTLQFIPFSHSHFYVRTPLRKVSFFMMEVCQ